MFKKGDVVFSEYYGEGVVMAVNTDSSNYPILVDFECSFDSYTLEGWCYRENPPEMHRYNIIKKENPMTEEKATKEAQTNPNKISSRFIHPRFTRELSLAHEAGAIKYGDYNFLKGLTASELIDAIKRHLDALQWGETNDEDCTKRLGVAVHHMGCVAANANMFLACLAEGTLTDDTYKREEEK